MPDAVSIIIGAGPAGLTAAYELLRRSGIKPVVLEMSDSLGGISRTITYHGNRMDLGGHRFFSKSERIMRWWLDILPLQGAPARDEQPTGPSRSPDPEATDAVMLLRRRLSRIFYRRKFFDYPISLTPATLANLGLGQMLAIGSSYVRRRVFPLRQEKSLEEFLINRFGDTLYRLFFRDYTEKVWGVPPSAIQPDWGSQRIQGLSITKVLLHALSRRRLPKDVAPKDVEPSLIEWFYYPKFGPGQLWELVGKRIIAAGGEIRMQQRVVGLTVRDGRVREATVRDERSGQTSTVTGDAFFSTMPVAELIAAMGETPPHRVRQVAGGLAYRNFLVVGLLLKRFKLSASGMIPDLWVYIQERDVKVGRMQIFNNWSPYLVRDPDTVWIGLEYFSSDGDPLDIMPDTDMAAFAVGELVKLGMADAGDVLDWHVARMPKAYPAYFGTYDAFDVVRDFTDTIANLSLIGRNGQHRYNNMDHSMLTAMAAVDNLLAGRTAKDNIWAVNTERAYHEQK